MKVVPLVNSGVLIDCDISKLTEQDYQDINEIYLDKLLIAFVNQPFESIPFANNELLVRKQIKDCQQVYLVMENQIGTVT